MNMLAATAQLDAFGVAAIAFRFSTSNPHRSPISEAVQAIAASSPETLRVRFETVSHSRG